MDKQKLIQYRALKREIPKLERDIDKLYKRLDDVEEVAGKVTKSSDSFPYIEEHITVRMADPKQADLIKKQIKSKEYRLEVAEKWKTEIEDFIAGIEDSLDRQIFELHFLEGMKQYEVGDTVGYTKGRVSQIISSYTQD